MNWLTGMFSGGNVQAPAATTAPANQGQQASPEATQQVQQQTNAATTNTQANVSNDPLDLFLKLGQNSGNGQQGQAPQFTIPQDTLTAVANQLDYSKAIPQEALQKLQSGDVSALPEIINSALRAQYTTIMQQMPQLTQAYVDNRAQFDRQGLQADVRNQVVESSLTDLKNLHPIAQNMFRQTAKSLAQEYPDATPQEIQARAWEMMENLGNQFSRTTQVQQQQQKASEVDWDKFIG